MKKMHAAAQIVALGLVLAGCATIPPAPRTADGEKVEIMVLCDRGDPDAMTERQYQYRVEIGRWMERDMLRLLNDAGYRGTLVQSEDAYTPGEGRYLVEVRIVSYNPGSAAGRAFVGYGVGARTLNCHYTFSGSPSAPLLEWDDGCASSRKWTRLCRKLNENTIRRVTKALKKSTR